jgi:hypothetical protein
LAERDLSSPKAPEEELMAYCEPCKQEGRGLIVAHYQAYRDSHSGQTIPAMCFYHRRGMKPPEIAPAPREPGEASEQLRRATREIPRAETGAGVDYSAEPEDEIARPTPPTKTAPAESGSRKEDNAMDPKLCACGCGEELNPGSPWNFKRGHKPKRNGAAATAPAARKSRVSPPRKSISKPAAPKAESGVATICVSEKHLDAYWLKLSLEDKAAFVQSHLELQLEGA